MESFLELLVVFWIVSYLRPPPAVVQQGGRWWWVAKIWVRMNLDGSVYEQESEIEGNRVERENRKNEDFLFFGAFITP